MTGELPGTGILFDFTYSREQKRWQNWSALVPAYVHEPERKFYDILVPTVETVSTQSH